MPSGAKEVLRGLKEAGAAIREPMPLPNLLHNDNTSQVLSMGMAELAFLVGSGLMEYLKG